MVAAGKTIVDTCILILGVKVLRCLEVLDRFEVAAGLQLRDTSPVEGLRIARVDLNGVVEVVNSKLVISHILIHKASSDEDCLVFGRHLVEDL